MSAMNREPHQASKEDLMRVLSANMLRQMQVRQWNQSDVARASGLTRDSISSYCKRKALPQVPQLAKLAQAFGCKPSDLMPSDLDMLEMQGPASAGPQSASLRILPGDPAYARITLNEVVRTETAIEIMRLLAADNAELSNDNSASDRN